MCVYHIRKDLMVWSTMFRVAISGRRNQLLEGAAPNIQGIIGQPDTMPSNFQRKSKYIQVQYMPYALHSYY